MRIGSLNLKNPFILAPMDGFTDVALRLMCRRAGAALCFTEMISAEALVRKNRKALARLEIGPEDRPIAAQIVGKNPANMAEAARICEQAGADIVDINAGCPSRRVTNGGAGAALLSDLKALERILRAVTAAVTVPVTLKMRAGSTHDSIVVREAGQLAESCGIAAITLHARTRAQGFSGHARWSWIRELRAATTVPVIGNGDVKTAHDALRLMEETGCDGVMVGRAALGRPWLFSQMTAAFEGREVPGEPGPDTRKTIILQHFDELVRASGGNERLAAILFRKHLTYYVRGLPGAAQVRAALPGLNGKDMLVALLDKVLK